MEGGQGREGGTAGGREGCMQGGRDKCEESQLRLEALSEYYLNISCGGQACIDTRHSAGQTRFSFSRTVYSMLKLFLGLIVGDPQGSLA
jgi:hypothetical protein